MNSKLHIERSPRGYVDRWRSYDVVVNGKVRAQLRRGETATIEVEPGQLEVHIEIDWCRSQLALMNLDPGSEGQLLCRPRSLLTAFYGITFGRDTYIHLEAGG